MSQPIIIQGTRKILASGSILVDRQSEPVLITYDGAELEIDLELDAQVIHWNGSISKRAVSENAASYTGEVKERPIGKAIARYSLEAFPVGDVDDVYPLGPEGKQQLSWLLRYEVTEPSLARQTQPHAAVDWSQPARPNARAHEQVGEPVEWRNPALMTYEQQQAYFAKNPFAAMAWANRG